MIPTATADKILAAKKCGDLFSKADKATVVLEYRKLAKEFHPDVCPLPNAEDVFKHLSKLYEEALDLLAQGQWEISNVVSIRDNCGKTYQGRYLKTFQFELGVAYVADLSVTYILDKQNKRVTMNMTIEWGTRLCTVKGESGYFHTWEHYSKPLPASPLVGGEPAGVFSQVFGIVEFKDGIRRVDPTTIVFRDEENAALKVFEEKEKTHDSD